MGRDRRLLLIASVFTICVSVVQHHLASSQESKPTQGTGWQSIVIPSTNDVVQLVQFLDETKKREPLSAEQYIEKQRALREVAKKIVESTKDQNSAVFRKAEAEFVSASVMIETRNAMNDIKEVRPLFALFTQVGSTRTMVASTEYTWVALPENYPANPAEVNASADAFASIKPDALHWNWTGPKPSTTGCKFDVGTYIANPRATTCFVAQYTSVDSRLLENPAFKGVMDGVLIATPNFHSRYTGTFKGVIVAHFALGSLDRLDFIADQRFAGVSILPKLNRPVVTIAK